jgi:hypothetical protein
MMGDFEISGLCEFGCLGGVFDSNIGSELD